MARIPLQVASQRLDTGPTVSYPQGGGPIAAAVENAGARLSQLADHFRAKKEREDAFDTDVIKAEMQGRIALLEDETVANASADGSNIHDSVYGSLDPVSQRALKPGGFDQLFDEFAARVPESQRAQFSALKESIRLNGSQRLGRAQLNRRREYEGVQLTKAQDTFINSIIQTDPDDKGAFDSFLKQGSDFITKSGMDALDKEKALYNWQANAAKALAQAMIQKDPTQVRALLGLPGASKSVVDRIIGVESGGNASAKNPNSSATGLGQFTSGTWLATVRKHEPALLQGKSQAEVLALRKDPAISRRMTEHLVSDNSAALSAAGVPVNDATIYLAHFAGAGGAVAVLKADPNASVASILGGPAVRANPFLGGKSASDLIAWAAKKMGGPVPEPDPRFAMLPPDDRWSLANQADTQVRENQVQFRSALETITTSAPIAIQNTGNYSGTLPGPEAFEAAYGPQEGAARYSTFTTGVETAKQVHAMQTMAPTEIQSILAAARPTSSGDDAVLETRRYEALQSAAEQTIKAREADPAGYARSAFPNVNQAWNGATQPGGYQAAIAASVAAQEFLGVENIQPLPKDIAARAVESFKNEQLPEGDRIAAATNVLMATPDPSQRRALFNQLVDAGLPDITEGAFEAMARGDQGAASRLFRAAMTDPSKLPGELAEKPAAIDAKIQSALMDDGMIGDVYYGLTNGTAENLARAERDSKLITNAVGLRMRSGEDIDAAIQSVAKDLYGDVQVVTGNGEVNAEFVLPAGEDADAVLSGLAAEMPKVRDAVQAVIAVPDAPTADGSRAVVDAVTSGYADDVLAEGYFRHTDGGYVFIDPFTGDPVPGADGMPMVFKPSVVPSAAEKTPFSGRAVDDAAARQSAFQ